MTGLSYGLKALQSEHVLSAEEVRGLLEAARVVTEDGPFEVMARQTFAIAKKLVGATAGYVALLNDCGDENEVLFLDPGGRNCAVDPSLPMPVRGLRAQAYETGRCVFENAFAGSAWQRGLPEHHVIIDNVMFSPLVVEGTCLGLIGLANKQGDFTERDADLAGALGELTATGLRSARAKAALRHREHLYRAVVETAADAIITCDAEGRVLTWNRGAELILGHDARDVLGRSFHELLPEGTQEAHQRSMRQAFERGGLLGPVTRQGLEIQHRDGHLMPVELSLSLWDDGDNRFATAIVRDVTERARAEVALQRYKDELERLVAQRTRQLEDQAVRLETLLAEVNHRVRNNLNALLGMIAAERDRGASPAEADRLQDLSQRIRGLARVHDLLSDVDWAPLPLDSVLRAVVGEALDGLGSVRDSRVRIRADTCMIDSRIAHHLAMVATELATNAWKHGRREGLALELDVTASEHDGQLRLVFRDRGPGYPVQVIEGRESVRGLGMSLVKGIVGHSLGGQVSLGSEDGAVTRIEFRLVGVAR